MAASTIASTERPVTVTYMPKTLVVKEALPVLNALAYAIFDVDTGLIIAKSGSDEPLPIASVTKLLTAGAVLRTLRSEDNYTVLQADTEAYGRAGRLSAGESYTAHELLFPLLLESSNDASAVYERVTQGEIVKSMNLLARDLGATTLNVADASGLSDKNQASVNDLAIMTSALYKSEPHLFDITQLSRRAGPYVSWTNTNPVLDESYKGGKHGFTEAANRTLVALYDEKFTTGNKTLGYILLGSEDLTGDTKTLREFVKQGVRLE